MIGRTNAGGGGGGGLNFKVVGNPQPSNPKENMIWINTDVKITSYDFNAIEPENPVQGMVWFSVGTSSAVAFNALKKNGIQVYPLSAKQYVDGTWVDKTAKSYQNGEWVDWWNGELYDYGNKRENITGGWIGTQCNSSYIKNGGVLTVNQDHLHLTNVSGGSFGVKTANVLDLTSYTVLHVLAVGMFGIVVANDFPSAKSAYKASADSDTNYTEPKELTVRLDGVDSGRIAVTNLNVTDMKVYKVWLS